jgi:cell division protein FtsZ
MDRRQFLQTLNANGMGAILPASAFVKGITAGNTQLALPRLVADKKVAEEAGSAWDIPKFGLVSVGGIGGTCLPTSCDPAQSLPYLNRTVAVDTDGIELRFMNANRKALVGDGRTLLNPHTAGLLARSAGNQIADAVAGLDMVLLIAGMGGATGSVVAPIVGQVLREQGILTLAFAVMPFECEGAQRKQIAHAGVRELQPHVDAVIPFFNNHFDPDAKKVRWLSASAQQAPLAFIEVCRNIMNPVCRPGLVNIDFEDLRHNILSQGGGCAFGFGSAIGTDGAATATLNAIDHPLLGRGRLQRASAVLVAIAAPQQFLKLQDSKTALNSIRKQIPRDAYVIYGSNYDDNLGNEITVSILANGIRET